MNDMIEDQLFRVTSKVQPKVRSSSGRIDCPEELLELNINGPVRSTIDPEVEAAERELLTDYIRECEEKLQSKADLRATNDIQDYTSSEEQLQGLDCGVKKNSAFVKKLKNMTEGQKESLIKDMLSLNLSKYISEVAAALVEAKLKMSDIPMAIKICSLLHQRYSDFSSQLLESWSKCLPKKSTDLTSLNLSKMRIDIRFFAELITCGIFKLKEGLPILGNLLTLLATSDKDNHNHLSIILTFCRHCGDDYAGLIPRKMRILSDKYGVPLRSSDFLSPERQKSLRNLLRDYYKSLTRHIIRDHKSLSQLEKQNRRILITKGDLGEHRKERFDLARTNFQKLWFATQQLADLLDLDEPKLPSSNLFIDHLSHGLAQLNLLGETEVNNNYLNTSQHDCDLSKSSIADEADEDPILNHNKNTNVPVETLVDCAISPEYDCDFLWTKVDSILTRSVKKLFSPSFLQDITKIVPWTNGHEAKAHPPKYTLAQVSEHCTPYDCWIVLFDKVYDVTDFMYEHPGGDYIIAENAGRDATIAFSNSRHGKDAFVLMEKYFIGDLVESDCIYNGIDYFKNL